VAPGLVALEVVLQPDLPAEVAAVPQALHQAGEDLRVRRHLAHLGGAQIIGPILMGMSKPAHVLQRGADVDEIVNIAAIAVVDAQDASNRGAHSLEAVTEQISELESKY
jgi:hypothetical protein